MNIIDILNKKRLGEALKKEELEFTIKGYLDGVVDDAKMASLLMAICINGMTKQEVYDLTDIFLKSGDTINLDSIEGIKVDKHSTGGIGDKTTLVLAPLVASANVTVAKMSGRSLGFTGGTIDKLESIPNFKTSLTVDEFLNQVKTIGVALTSQTGNLVPADKKIYALRDVTATVESIPLIASSVMSKKLASGVDKIVIDLKVGRGALVKTLDDAKELANLMVAIGKHYQKETICVLTNMDEPLGYAIGNSLEVMEAMEALKGNGPKDLEKLVLTIGSYMVSLAKNISYNDAWKVLKSHIDDNSAYQKFLELVKFQHGQIEKLQLSSKVFSIKSPKTGFVKKIDAMKLGELVRSIGGGRYNKDDVIDYQVGFVLNKKVGDYVLADEELVKVYLNDIDINVESVLSCFEIALENVKKEPLIYGVIK